MQKRFENIKEYYAAGFYEEPKATYFERYSRGLRRYLENLRLTEYKGGLLYPCGVMPVDLCMAHHCAFTVNVIWDELESKDKVASDALKKELPSYWDFVPSEHQVGGCMWAHSFPNFGRIEKEGLDSYEERIKKMSDEAMRKGLCDVIEGIRAYHSRCVEHLEKIGADKKLCHALKKVPFRPAETLYEALVCRNFIYYLDGCDNIGRLDAELIDFYKGEDVTDVLRSLFKNIDDNNGWSGALGPDYNPLTIQCLCAIKGMRRPSLELRVTPHMPDEVWTAALESIKTGGGNPSLYNEDGYQLTLEEHFPHIPKEDLLRFCGGGCTETMLVGISNVGSLDAGVNVAYIFEQIMRKYLPKAKSFEEFYSVFINECNTQIKTVLDGVSKGQKLRAETRPNPMRTLLIDDCIDKEKDFTNGGARYSWSDINLAGMINVVDSMLVIEHLVFDTEKMSGTELLERMDKVETFLNCTDIPRHGTDSDKANRMAHRVTEDLCRAFEGETPWLGGRFLPASIQFTTYVEEGAKVGATPDGRKAGAPLCDSIGAIHGNDKGGITALLNSAAALSQSKLAGTPILNIKLEASKAIDYLKPLVKGYFEKGGLQMQVTCVNRDDLIDAVAHPENHQNLVIRIGGYSEYFTRLTPEQQQSVIERTEY